MKASLYEGGVAGCLGYLIKRAVLLVAKLLGFKGFCLFLATALLCLGKIGEDVWLTLAVTLVCSASGIRVMDSFREGADALAVRNLISARPSGSASVKGDDGEHEVCGKDDSGVVSGGSVPALPSPAGGSGPSAAAVRAARRKAGRATSSAAKGYGEKGRERIRAVLEEASRYIE